MFFLILHFYIILCTASLPSNKSINGLIEGFYWTASNAVHGEYDLYTKQQRDQMITFINNEINFYFHCPQDRENDPFTMTLWNENRLSDWSDTVKKASTVHIVMGLRPRWIDTVEKSLEKIKLKLAQFVSIGIRYYILCWDDVAGADTNEQMLLQRNLINALVQQVTNIELIGIIPAYYARSQVSDQTNEDWADKLSILNQIPSGIRFFVTGSAIVPSSIQTTDIPSLSNRQFIFFDNWIAVDSNMRVTMTWPPNRHQNIYKSSQSISGTVVNLAYPPERIIHQVYALKQRIHDQSANINSHFAAESWASYLIENQFYDRNLLEQLKSDLQSLIDYGYETNVDIIHQYPLLERIFTN